MVVAAHRDPVQLGAGRPDPPGGVAQLGEGAGRCQAELVEDVRPVVQGPRPRVPGQAVDPAVDGGRVQHGGEEVLRLRPRGQRLGEVGEPVRLDVGGEIGVAELGDVRGAGGVVEGAREALGPGVDLEVADVDLDILVLRFELGDRAVHHLFLGAAVGLVEQPDPQGAGEVVLLREAAGDLGWPAGGECQHQQGQRGGRGGCSPWHGSSVGVDSVVRWVPGWAPFSSRGPPGAPVTRTDAGRLARVRVDGPRRERGRGRWAGTATTRGPVTGPRAPGSWARPRVGGVRGGRRGSRLRGRPALACRGSTTRSWRPG